MYEERHFSDTADSGTAAQRIAARNTPIAEIGQFDVFLADKVATLNSVLRWV